VYGEDLASGARVAVFGDPTHGLAEELAQRGARLVHVYDPDVARVAEATARRHDRSIFYAPLPDSGDLGVRDGAFDLVIVPDLSFVDNPESLLALVRRVLSPLGAALIASPNKEAEMPLIPIDVPERALGYYELYETVAAQFSTVRMIGQAPFVGYSVAEFSVEDPEPTIDTSLAESEGKEPDWFIALASDRDIRLESFALIELPLAVQPLASEREEQAPGPVSARPEFAEAPASERSGTVLVNILEAEREAALASLRQQEQAVKEERFRADHTSQELSAAREEVLLSRERCRALEQTLEEAEKRRSELEAELELAHRNPELAALTERLEGLSAIAQDLADEHEQEVARLEAQLRERGREVQDLRAEVERRDQLVREMIATNHPPAAPSSEASSSNGHEGVIADLSARLDRLATEAATREADLTAAKWKISQLERELAQQR